MPCGKTGGYAPSKYNRGGQEKGLRAGTENLALVSGFTRALEIASRDRDKEANRLKYLQSHFVETVLKEVPSAEINTPLTDSLPNIVSVSMPGILSEMILLSLDRSGIMVSVGSACASAQKEPGSYVIRAIGKPELAESTLRFSFGRFTTLKEVDRVLKIFCHVANRGKMEL